MPGPFLLAAPVARAPFAQSARRAMEGPQQIRSTMRSYLPRSWVSPKLAAGKSAIHGVGVIASVPISKGERLMEFGGLQIDGKAAASGDYRARSVWLAAQGLYLALPKSDPIPSIDENLNHCCDANAWLTDEVTLSARRDIEPGEEITLDQGTWNFDEDEYVWDQPHCTCGSAHCRKRLTHNDWQREDVQARYRGHFHPFLQPMIDRRRIVREAHGDDAAAIDAIVKAAFDSASESELVANLARDGDNEIALVAEEDDRIVGHVVLSRMKAPFRALALAPVSVVPDRQGRGIGSMLVRTAIARAREGGWIAIFVLGAPAYYGRFGFDVELAAGFSSPYAGEHFMALALDADLPVTSGDLVHAPAFTNL
jgi:putative acetyltransferase